MKSREKLTELCYTLCIAYMLGFNILYKISGFPYTMVCLMLLAMMIHLVCSKIVINFTIVCAAVLVLLSCFTLALCLYDSRETAAYFVSFISLGFFGLYCSLFRADMISVFRNVAYILIGYMFLFGGFNHFREDYFNASCTILPGICCCFLYAHSLWKTGKKIRAAVWYGIFTAFAFYLLKGGSRSSVVSLVTFFMLCIYTITKSRILKVVCVTAGALGCVAILKIKIIILFLDQYFTAKNIDFYFITKSAFKIKHGTLSSGRGEIMKNVFDIQSIFQFLWGRGISGFENEYGTYAHNIFLDIFADYGLIGIAFTLIFIYFFLKRFRKSDLEERKLYLLILGSCIFPLLFSFSYWRFPAVFLFLGLILTRTFHMRIRQ